MELVTDIVVTLALAFIAIVLWTLSRGRPSKLLPPGPRGLPLIGHFHLLGGLPHRSLQQLSRIHGPLMQLRFGTVPVVVASSPDMAREVLKTHDLAFASRPYLMLGDHAVYNFHDIGFAPYGDSWRSLRKLCSTELFTTKRVDAFLGVRMEELSMLIARLLAASATNEVVEIRSFIKDFKFNVIARILLGRSFLGDAVGMDSGKAREFVATTEKISRLGGSFNVSEYVPRALRWIDWNIPRMKRLHFRRDKFLDGVVEEHKLSLDASTRLAAPRDFTDILLSNFNQGESPVDMAFIKGTLADLLPAGTDTTIAIIEWIMAELLRTPKVLQKAHEELDAVVGRDRIVKEEDFPKLDYMNAIIKEGFRLHPSAALLIPHMAQFDCKVAGYDIPRGTTLLVNTFAIGRDPAVWEDATSFVPERFLEGAGAKMDVHGQDFELLPFGSGRRGCPGIQLGLRTVQLAVCNLIHGFDWNFPVGIDRETCSMDEDGGLVNFMASPLQVVVTPRLPPHAYESQ